MSPLTMEFTDTLVVVTCWCGINHAVPDNLYAKQKRDFEDGRTQTGIFCPLGHTHIHAGESKAKRLERQLESERNRSGRLSARLGQTEASLRAQKGATTRAKKRHAAGVCPCCKRTFQQLARHMETKHPDYKPEP